MGEPEGSPPPPNLARSALDPQDIISWCAHTALPRGVNSGSGNSQTRAHCLVAGSPPARRARAAPRGFPCGGPSVRYAAGGRPAKTLRSDRIIRLSLGGTGTRGRGSRERSPLCLASRRVTQRGSPTRISVVGEEVSAPDA